MRNRLTELEIESAGIQLTVTGIFTPSESAVMYYSDMRATCFSAEFDIDSVQINGQEINDILSEDQFDEIEDKMY
jgi:hypothetical protein